MAGERLAQKITKLVNNSKSNFLYGTVTSIDPIKIKVDGLPELNKNQIILSDNVKEKIIKIPSSKNPGHTHIIQSLTTDPAGQDSHTHTIQNFETDKALLEITLREGLKIGDKVFIIQSNDNQLFYVSEVVKDDTNKN